MFDWRKEQAEFAENLSGFISTVIDNGDPETVLATIEDVRTIFKMLRAAKSIELIPKDVRTSDADVKTLRKLVSAWLILKTPTQHRASICHYLREIGLPTGLCELIELNIKLEEVKIKEEGEEV